MKATILYLSKVTLIISIAFALGSAAFAWGGYCPDKATELANNEIFMNSAVSGTIDLSCYSLRYPEVLCQTDSCHYGNVHPNGRFDLSQSLNP